MKPKKESITPACRDYLVALAVVLVGVAFALLPSLHQNPAAEPLQAKYMVAAPRERVARGVALYADGEMIAVAADEAALENAVDTYVSSRALLCFDEYESCSPASELEYIEGEYSESSFSPDISAALENADIPVNVTLLKSVTKTVERETVYIDNAELLEGKENVISHGNDGEMQEVYRLTYTDNRLRETELVTKTVIRNASDKVVERGIMLESSKELTTLALFITPYDGGITSEYGRRYLFGSSFHGGLDIAAKVAGDSCNGDPVVASGDGTVIMAQSYSAFGNLVIIQHSNGIRTYYAHLKNFTVKSGSTVKQGQIIGHIGATGQAEGPHIHFEVRLPDKNGEYYRVDPRYYIIDYEKLYR